MKKKSKKNKQFKKILMAVSAGSIFLKTLHELINSDEMKLLRKKLKRGKVPSMNGFGKGITESVEDFESA